jgi:hypothetical protein
MMVISVRKFDIHPFDDGRRAGHCKGHIEFPNSQLGVAVALEKCSDFAAPAWA